MYFQHKQELIWCSSNCPALDPRRQHQFQSSNARYNGASCPGDKTKTLLKLWGKQIDSQSLFINTSTFSFTSGSLQSAAKALSFLAQALGR